ncbi:hypothetical protein Bbelb_079950 [Branchiostoma belcheri]|nr:hypothetical protein Bbelb_079950 [Branchiostoma belcheri]
MINGFNSRCLQVITKKHFRDTATNPDYNLMLTIRRRRLRYLGHILRMDPSRLVRRTVEAYVCGGDNPPEGSLLMDCKCAYSAEYCTDMRGCSHGNECAVCKTYFGSTNPSSLKS